MRLRKYGTGLLAAAMVLTMLGGCGENARGNKDIFSSTSSENSTTEDEKETFDIFSDSTKKKVETIESLIDQKFYFDEDSETRERIYYKGILAGLGDPYSTYYSKEEMEAIEEDDSGEYVGIGATVSKNMETGAIYVVKPLRGSPAEEAGLLPEDIFVEIDGVPLTTGIELSEAVKMIRGSTNSTARLKMYREGEDDYRYFDVERRVVQNISVEYEMLENGFGYISVSEFVDNTYTQFVEAVDYVTEQGAKALILDLRNNPGGFTSQATSMADYLLEDDSTAKGENENKAGLLLSMKDKNKATLWEDFCRDRHSVDLPMAVLINANTASSAEILAGDLQDYEKAVLVGVQSYGKGIVQQTYKLDDGSGVKLTTAAYFLPSGRSIHGEGLTPDVECEVDVAQRRRVNIPHNEDEQLQRAIEELGGTRLP